ncbi:MULTISPECIES: GGDEF domain-containing protein [Kitasatospora]|uniref:GGDEF domain-containing protein n=1 Tax=Kitasatospora cystarginea TaxID=58350 RepID=A0ABN3EUF6_9ACTN
MSTQLLTGALAGLSATGLAAAALSGLRLRRLAAGAAERESGLRQRIAELEAERDALQRTASYDPQTGVWNYRHLQLTLDREVERCRRAGAGTGPRRLALLMMEITGFEAVVAEHGRRRANAVLRDLAQRLSVEIRRSDTLGRYGGEEFLVLLPDTGAEGAAHVAERLCWSVRRHQLLDWSPAGPQTRRPVGGNGLTAAIGIAVLPADGMHAAVLLRAADRALARARSAGGDCWRSAQQSEHTGDEGPVSHTRPVDPVHRADPVRRSHEAALARGADGAGPDVPRDGPEDRNNQPENAESTGNLAPCTEGAAPLTSIGAAHPTRPQPPDTTGSESDLGFTFG